MTEIRTTSSILAALKTLSQERKALNPEVYVDAALNLTLLMSDDTELYEELRQKVAQMKLDILNKQEKRNVAAAELIVEASNEYKAMRIQEEKVDQIKEMIRVSKKLSEINTF